jgi:hypothetical protein
MFRIARFAMFLALFLFGAITLVVQVAAPGGPDGATRDVGKSAFPDIV